MKLDDALFNWLQISIVANARPDDTAARDTVDFFYSILIEEHRIEELEIVGVGDDLLQIRYRMSGGNHQKSFDRNHACQLLQSINENPKYNE